MRRDTFGGKLAMEITLQRRYQSWRCCIEPVNHGIGLCHNKAESYDPITRKKRHSTRLSLLVPESRGSYDRALGQSRS